MTKHVVNFSGGACSFWAAVRVVERYGPENVTLLFADVLIEDQDLYDFNEWASQYLSIPITRVSREKTPWQLFREEGLIANNRSPICSIKLKREPLEEWHRKNLTPKDSLFGEPDVIYVGLDWNEPHRLEHLRKSNPQWHFVAPMQEWPPLWDKCKMLDELKKIYGTLPRAYTDEFPHNNCGRRCVRAGISHFVRLYKTDPEQFLDWEREEQTTIAEFTARGISSGFFSVLKDRRGGETKPMTFEQLRGRILANDSTLPKDDWGGCGCSTY